MTDDDGILRARLARLDPARQAEADGLIESPTAQEIRERVMQTIEESSTTTEDMPRTRRLGLLAGVAAGVAAIAIGAAVLSGGDSAPTQAPAPTTMALTAPAGPGTTMSSCMMFDVEILKQVPVAFGGTVVDVAPQKVTIDVDRWYKGGSADQVTVATLDSQHVSLDGVEFVKGNRYLVTATEGVVNVCGLSGPATPEFEKSFAEAFPG